MDTSKTFAERVEQMKAAVAAGQPIEPKDLIEVAEIVLVLGSWVQAINSSMLSQVDILQEYAQRVEELEERLADEEDFTEAMSRDLEEVEELLGLDEDEEAEEEAGEEEGEYDLDFLVVETEVDDKEIDVVFLHDADVSTMTDAEFDDCVQGFLSESEAEYFAAIIVDIDEVHEMEDEAFDKFVEDIARSTFAGLDSEEEETIAEEHS